MVKDTYVVIFDQDARTENRTLTVLHKTFARSHENLHVKTATNEAAIARYSIVGVATKVRFTLLKATRMISGKKILKSVSLSPRPPKAFERSAQRARIDMKKKVIDNNSSART